MIKVLFFARMREQLGAESEELEIAPELTHVSAVTERLKSRGGVWGDVFSGDERVMIAVNQELANADTAIKDGDEIAYFPPVTGG